MSDRCCVMAGEIDLEELGGPARVGEALFAAGLWATVRQADEQLVPVGRPVEGAGAAAEGQP